MLNRTVSPAHPDVHVIEQAAQPANNILVGAYCRVSTDLEVQRTSLDVQMMAYERIINDHPGWVLADIAQSTAIKHHLLHFLKKRIWVSWIKNLIRPHDSH